MRIVRGKLPYIVHPFSVAILVAEDGASDDVVTAALLHDTLEDTDTTREEIAKVFNEDVAVLVESVSEIKEKNEHTLSWHERKNEYIALVERASDDALLIAIADKIDNTESRLEEYEQEGESLLKHWGQPNEEYLWFHGEVLKIAEERLPDHRLTKRLAEVHAQEKAISTQ